jgi:hypothetical protein
MLTNIQLLYSSGKASRHLWPILRLLREHHSEEFHHVAGLDAPQDAIDILILNDWTQHLPLEIGAMSL